MINCHWHSMDTLRKKATALSKSNTFIRPMEHQFVSVAQIRRAPVPPVIETKEALERTKMRTLLNVNYSRGVRCARPTVSCKTRHHTCSTSKQRPPAASSSADYLPAVSSHASPLMHAPHATLASNSAASCIQEGKEANKAHNEQFVSLSLRCA